MKCKYYSKPSNSRFKSVFSSLQFMRFCSQQNHTAKLMAEFMEDVASFRVGIEILIMIMMSVKITMMTVII